MLLVNRGAPLWGALALIVVPVGMQTALAQGQQAVEIEEIVVTGTRIRDPNVVSSSQITTSRPRTSRIAASRAWRTT